MLIILSLVVLSGCKKVENSEPTKLEKICLENVDKCDAGVQRKYCSNVESNGASYVYQCLCVAGCIHGEVSGCKHNIEGWIGRDFQFYQSNPCEEMSFGSFTLYI